MYQTSFFGWRWAGAGAGLVFCLSIFFCPLVGLRVVGGVCEGPVVLAHLPTRSFRELAFGVLNCTSLTTTSRPMTPIS